MHNARSVFALQHTHVNETGIAGRWQWCWIVVCLHYSISANDFEVGLSGATRLRISWYVAGPQILRNCALLEAADKDRVSPLVTASTVSKLTNHSRTRGKKGHSAANQNRKRAGTVTAASNTDTKESAAYTLFLREDHQHHRQSLLP